MKALIAFLLMFGPLFAGDGLQEARERMNAAKAKAVQVEVVPPPATAGFEAYETALSEVVASEVKPVNAEPQRKLFVWGADWCGPCIADNARLDPLISTEGYSAVVVHVDGEAAGPEERAKYRVSAYPTYMVYDGPNPVYYRKGAGVSWDEIKQALGPPPVAAKDTAVGAVRVGKLNGFKPSVEAFLEQFKRLVGDNGSLELAVNKGGKSGKFEVAGVTIEVPAAMTATWKREGDGVRVEMKPFPVVRYKIFAQRVRGIVVKPDLISLDLPWMVDAEVEVR